MSEQSDARKRFDISPEQYHAGLDKLWDALRITTVQDTDVFTLAADRIEALKAIVEKLLRIADNKYVMPGCGQRVWVFSDGIAKEAELLSLRWKGAENVAYLHVRWVATNYTEDLLPRECYSTRAAAESAAKEGAASGK